MGTAAWFSLGILALTQESSNAHTVGLLPPLWLWVVLALGGAVLTVLVRHIPLTLAVLPIIVALPWSGVRFPPALIWCGPPIAIVWLALLFATARIDVGIYRARAAGL